MRKKFDHTTEDFINEFVKAMREGNTAIFAGAGLSVSTGYFDWKKLLEPIAKKLQLDIKDEHDLTALAQFFVDNRGGIRHQLTKILAAEFSKTGITISENHRIIARLPIDVFWTTNYDDLIEKSLLAVGKLPDVKRNQDNLSVNIPKRDAIVYKMHGDLTDLANTVLTKHEYEDYNQKRELFSNAFKADFISRTMLFIGFSFTDPNLDYLISRVRVIQQHNLKTDYYFIKKDKTKKGSNRQQIRAKSLERYGLYPVWVSDYPDITKILKEIERRFLRSTVFISGSANDYGRFRKPVEFIQQLSYDLAKSGYKIISGFGYGVGTYVVNGVLHAMISENNNRIDSYIKLRPFPFIGHSDEEARSSQLKFRNIIVREAGVLICVFGNRKNEEEKIDDATGVLEEFTIAHENGLKIIPIGSTGFVARVIHNKLIENFQDYYPDYPKLKRQFQILGNNQLTHKEIINAVKVILNTINKF
jgi:hypothetical protein